MATHDKAGNSSNRSAFADRSLGIGLAAALLCELLLQGWLSDVLDGRLLLNPRLRVSTLPYQDVALSGVLTHMLHAGVEPAGDRHAHDLAELDLATWIEVLQNGLAQQLTEDRLAAADLVEQRTSRTFAQLLTGKSTTRYVPVTGNTSGWPATRLKRALSAGERLPEQDLAFAGIVLATGMNGVVLAGISTQESHYLNRQLLTGLRPQLHEVIKAAEYATDRLALTR